MGNEVTSEIAETVKTMSDGSVKISIEKYEEMLEKIADKDSRIRSLNETISKLRNEPPVINRTVVNKTPEMIAEEQRFWGGTCMGLGATIFAIGAFVYKAGKS